MISPNVLRSLFCVALLSSLGCGGGSEPATGATSDAAATDSTTDSTVDTASESLGSNESSSGESSSSPTPGPGPNMEHDAAYAGGSSSDAAMEADSARYSGGTDPNAAGEAGGSLQTPRKPPRPQNIADWTPDQIVEAIGENDAKVIPLIATFARKTRGDATGVAQIAVWLTALSQKPATPVQNPYEGAYGNSESDAGEDPAMMANYGGSAAGPAGPTAKEKIAQALLDALAVNGTKEAYLALSGVLSGGLDLGADQGKLMETAIVTLMKNVADPQNPVGGIMLQALKTVQLDGVDVKTEPAVEGAEVKPSQDVKRPDAGSLQKRAKELHLGFAIAAMNGLLGANSAPAKPNANAYGSMGAGGYEMPAMNSEMTAPPEGAPEGRPAPSARPVRVAPISLSREEAVATLSYLWSDEMIAYAVAQLTQHPESGEAFVFAASLPTPATRDAVQASITAHKLLPPQRWLHDSIFNEQLVDPAIHLLVKALPREQRPGTGAGGGGNYESGGTNPARRDTKPKEADPAALARKAASYGWMDVSQQILISLMQRMYQGSLQTDAKPYDPADLPLALHRGAEVTASLRFELPGSDNNIPGLSSAQKTVVNYVRIESSTMNERTVQHYRNALREKEIVTILSGNGIWLDAAVAPNRKNGTVRSVDVLLSKSGARPSIKPSQAPAQQDQYSGGEGDLGYAGGSGGAGGGGAFVVELLVVEIPPAGTTAPETEVSVKTP